MPHFIIDCSENIIQQHQPEKLMQIVYDTAEATGLFAENDIKVRIRTYEHFKLGKNKKDFIHIFGSIMEGRSIEQRADLSGKMIEKLSSAFPDISILSINIDEFERSTYCNKALIDPENTEKNRHFKN